MANGMSKSSLRGRKQEVGRDNNHTDPIIGQLRLVNNTSKGTRNICFINSVLQLLRRTGYGAFLCDQLSLQGEPPGSYKLCRALSNLYKQKTTRERSAAYIRQIVAIHSRKPYFDNSSQQDAEEFLRTLLTMISEELDTSVTFSNVQNDHFGIELIRRKFLNNSPSGSCLNCGQFPSSREEDFLCLKLTIPNSSLPVHITSLLNDHFSESTEILQMRCANCCVHDKEKIPCTQEGLCGNKPTANFRQISKEPKFLFIQLLRFSNGLDGPKVMTTVKLEERLVLHSGGTYELISVLDHAGVTLKFGHYVTHVKLESGKWILMDDSHIRTSSFKHANTSNNYILLLQKVEIDEHPCIAEVSVSDDNEDNNLQAISQTNFINSSNVDPLKNKFMSDQDLEHRIIELELNQNITTENKIELKKLKERRKKRKQRENMNQVQKEAARMKHKQLVKSLRDDESEAQKEERRTKNKQLIKSVRDGESEAQKEERRTKHKQLVKSIRDNESEAQKEERRAKHRQLAKNIRANESEAQKAARRAKQKDLMNSTRKGNTTQTRLEAARDRTMFGPIFPCVVCHQTLFKHQVVIYDQVLQKKFEHKCTPSLMQKVFAYTKGLKRIFEKDDKYITYMHADDDDDEAV